MIEASEACPLQESLLVLALSSNTSTATGAAKQSSVGSEKGTLSRRCSCISCERLLLCSHNQILVATLLARIMINHVLYIAKSFRVELKQAQTLFFKTDVMQGYLLYSIFNVHTTIYIEPH
jgi:hypothetical protein